jgi:hypothetical protein
VSAYGSGTISAAGQSSGLAVQMVGDDYAQVSVYLTKSPGSNPFAGPLFNLDVSDDGKNYYAIGVTNGRTGVQIAQKTDYSTPIFVAGPGAFFLLSGLVMMQFLRVWAPSLIFGPLGVVVHSWNERTAYRASGKRWKEAWDMF